MKLFTWITDRLEQYFTPTAEKAMRMSAIMNEGYSEKLLRKEMKRINLEIKREIKAGYGYVLINFPYGEHSYMFRHIYKHLSKKGYYVGTSFNQLDVDWRLSHRE